MTIAVVPSKLIHRANTGLLVGETPVTVTTTGGAITNPLNRLIASDQLYHPFADNLAAYDWDVTNRTELVKLYARTLIKSAITTSGVYINPAIAWVNDIRKRPGTETDNTYDGARFSTVAAGPVGIEIEPLSDVASPVTAGASLQGSALSAVYNWTSVGNSGYCMIFKSTGIGEIWEWGTLKKQFTWPLATTVKGYVELRDGLVRYWLIRDTDDVVLIRTVRVIDSIYPVRPVTMLYDTSATNWVRTLIFEGNEDLENVQVYGVLNWNLQDWHNPQSIDTTGDKTFTKDKDHETTYNSKERNLIAMGINLEWRIEEEYYDFRRFAQWHDTSIPFIFMDQARQRLHLKNPGNGLNDNEMFAQFVSSFRDDPIGPTMFGATVELRQMVDAPYLPLTASKAVR